MFLSPLAESTLPTTLMEESLSDINLSECNELDEEYDEDESDEEIIL